MKIIDLKEHKDEEFVVSGIVSHYKYKWHIKFYNENNMFGQFKSKYKTVSKIFLNGVNRVQYGHICYGEKEYEELKQKNNYKENYLEHLLIVTARNHYNSIKQGGV